jgi:hypothetical protein
VHTGGSEPTERRPKQPAPREHRHGRNQVVWTRNIVGWTCKANRRMTLRKTRSLSMHLAECRAFRSRNLSRPISVLSSRMGGAVAAVGGTVGAEGPSEFVAFAGANGAGNCAVVLRAHDAPTTARMTVATANASSAFAWASLRPAIGEPPAPSENRRGMRRPETRVIRFQLLPAALLPCSSRI